jgi:beta-glucosidase
MNCVPSRFAWAAASVAAILIALPGGCGAAQADQRGGPIASCKLAPLTVPGYADWPRIKSAIRKDPGTEAKIATMVAGMSLAEKVGQMTQPEIPNITPDEVRQYYIGSVLNGGGSWPGKNKHAAVADWLQLADAFWEASISTSAKVKIPLLWGIDAVHGHGNVYGATLFPHNIGLGAAHDPCLIRRIAAATARQIRVTGQDWTFAPTLAVVRNDRWGRSYEGFSENPGITRAYAGEMIRGLQDTEQRGEPGRRGSGASAANSAQRLGKHGVIATAKHFIGDGGTDEGIDQGVNKSSEAEMINTHGQGYYGALEAGVQTVMASFNSWSNADLGIAEGKVHGSKRLLNDILKQKLGFDGLIVSDWNGIGQVAGCSNFRCAQAINAGIDVFMVPDDWKAFIANIIDLVLKSEVPMSRIDDAVTRILRVKFRAGLFQQAKPSQREFAGESSRLTQRELARQAVQESLVLLKNNNAVLPLARNEKILVVGKSADSLPNQTGGWSLTWQGTGNSNADFPNGDTILAGIRQTAGDANVSFSEAADALNVADYKSVIAVIGETPYAEGQGDIAKQRTLDHAALHPRDLAVLNKVSGKGVPVVTVFVSGRPLYTNKELNRSDAFVAAWLPGTEGAGVADVLFRAADGTINKDFSGKLSYSWPRAACQTPLNVGNAAYDPLFAFGYGLTYTARRTVPQLDETSPTSCGQAAGSAKAR